MIKFSTFHLIVCTLFASASAIQAQNEFYINGNNVLNVSSPEVYINGNDTLNPTLFVQGELVNNLGELINNEGILELTGDFTNTANGISAKYESTGIERFSGNTDSYISGSLSGTTGDINQFYDLKIDKSASSNYVLLGANTNVNVQGSLEFEGNGIISTDGNNHSGNGADYDYMLYLRNPSPTSIVGHSTGSGAVNKYIEGKLMREVADTNTYYFPIGVSPGQIDGMESFEISVRSYDSLQTGLLGYVEAESGTNLASAITTYADLGSHPGGTATGLDFSNDPGNCSAVDGIRDRVILTLGQSHSWNVSPAVDTVIHSYDIQFFPGTALTASASFYTCGGLELVYLMKNDIPGGDGTVSGFGLPTFTAPGYVAAPNSSNSLAGQTSFSNFRNGGAVLNGTTLPVELISLTAYDVNNEHINVDWITATEINNEGFEIQRSLDAIHFETVGWVDGNGSTTQTQHYRFEDREVSKGFSYYYRLKQVDFDGEYELSEIVSASLKENENFSIMVYPNPSKVKEELIVLINSEWNSSAEIKVYDILGKVVIHDKLELTEGKNNYRLNNTSFAAGQYFIVVNMNLEQFSKNVIIID